MADKDSKTEKATPKKRRDQRKEGNVFFSKDVISVVLVLGLFYILKLSFPVMYESAGRFMIKVLTSAPGTEELTLSVLQHLGAEGMATVVRSAAAVMLSAVILAVLATGIQTRFIFTGKKIMPKFSNLSPLKGIRNLFSMKNLIELLKSVLKTAVLMVVLYRLIDADLIHAARTMGMDIKASATFMLNMAMDMVIQISMIFLVIAGLDYMYQRWDYEKNLRMSKQELKDEYKQTEGNPEIKGRIREIQRQRAQNRMMQEVPDADVIIRNPTHYAVALKYDPDRNRAPVVTAKGQDELALRIVKTGEENEVPVIENRPLARGIYASVPLGGEIPPDYYGVVAEILVEIFKTEQKHKK